MFGNDKTKPVKTFFVHGVSIDSFSIFVLKLSRVVVGRYYYYRVFGIVDDGVLYNIIPATLQRREYAFDELAFKRIISKTDIGL